MWDVRKGERRVWSGTYVALATPIEVAHVGYVNLEGTLYFLCERRGVHTCAV